MNRDFQPCMCGDSECWSCGTAQGTRTPIRSARQRCTFTYMVLTDGKTSTLHVCQGTLSPKRRTFRTLRHIATETVAGRLEGVHAMLNRKHATLDYPAFEDIR